MRKYTREAATAEFKARWTPACAASQSVSASAWSNCSWLLSPASHTNGADSTSSNTETERIPMFGTQTMATGQRPQVALWRNLFLKVIVVGAFILFTGLATIDDLLLIFR